MEISHHEKIRVHRRYAVCVRHVRPGPGGEHGLSSRGRAELFIRVYTATNEQFTNPYGENGGSGYVAYNLNRTKAFGLVADLGGYDSGNYNRQTFSYLFGPRLNLRKSRFVPYVQFLFGGALRVGRH